MIHDIILVTISVVVSVAVVCSIDILTRAEKI
jgi:hypothetical protein